MCGIFAYLNYLKPKERREICNILVAGLRRLEYRGYDSAGIGIDGKEGVPTLIKRRGNVNQLEGALAENSESLDMAEIMESHVGIAHTRWATHGEPSDINAHPQPSDPDNSFVIVHNGIITNYDVLRKFLETHGHVFKSETDTEVVAKLCKYMWDQHNGDVSFTQLVLEVIFQLDGAFALLVKSKHFPGDIIACKRGSPLILGVRRKEQKKHSLAETLEKNPSSLWNEDDLSEDNMQEMFFASDASAIVEHTREVIYFEDDDVVHVHKGRMMTYKSDRETKQLVKSMKEVNTLDLELESIMKGRFDHFMMKEIFEQPESLSNTMRGRVAFADGTVRLGGIMKSTDTIRRSRRILMFACGTSYHSCLSVRIAMEELTDIPVALELASDFQDRTPPIYRDDICCFISQSGETKDTLNALEYCLDKGAFTVGFTNTVGSSIARKTHCGVHLNAGAEIGVASTKAYTSQIMALLMFALLISENRACAQQRRKAIIQALEDLPKHIEEVLKLDSKIKAIAEELKDSRSMLVMGRGYQYGTCLEGALKIKEISYIHTEGIHSGELSHGPLALVSENVPVVMVCTADIPFINGDSTADADARKEEKMKRASSELGQVLARKGKPIMIVDEDAPMLKSKAYETLRVPQTINCLQTIVNIIPLQLLSYHLAVLRGHNVDCPRNLAKSVTV
jgi:glucosamine--fructose-6-phosphate aminotransferase (isomerizing)